jgi:TolA-binding protein
MSNNANNSNVQFFLDMLQNEFGGSQQSLDNNNNIDVQQMYELFRNISGIRSQSSSRQRVSVGSSNNRYNSSEGFVEPQAAQNLDSTPVQQTSNIRHNSLDDQIRRNQNSIRDMIDDYNENMIQYNRNMDRWMISYNNNIHQYQRNTEHIIGVLQEFQTHIIHPPSRTSFVNPPRANTRTGNRYTTRNNNNPINWTAFIPLRYNSTRYLDNRLTQAQIDTSTQTIEYNADMDEERCPISWEDFVVGEQICQIKECEHIFKSTSLLNWLRTNSHCPVCRYDLRTYNGTTPGRVSRNTSNRSNRTRPEQVSDIDVSLNTVDMDNQDANENPYIDNNDEIETIYTTSIDLDINSINNLDAILESVMQQIGDDIVRSYDASNNDI